MLVRPERIWQGSEADDEAGQAVATGDVDSDGVAELILGAPSGFVYGTDAARSHSGAYLVAGDAPSGLLDDVAAATFLGWKNGDYIGITVAITGDVTGDDQPDVLIGGEASENPPVDLQIYAGPVTGTVGVADAHTRLVFDGSSGPSACCAARCGDLDGDGQDEVCPGWGGSPTDWGFSGAFVFRGPLAAGDLAREEADVELHAPTAETAGAPQGGCDLTGDGLDDLRVSAQGRDDAAGAVYVVSDPSNGVVLLGDFPVLTGDPGSNAGSKTASGGDLDGDGRLDFFVSGHMNANRTGRAWVVTDVAPGPLSGHGMVLDGSNTGDWFGIDGAIGDFDGDGAADLAVGVPRDWYSSFDAPGRVALWYGPMSGPRMTEADADTVLRGSALPDGFGARLAADDTDGDGDAELVVGAPKDSTSALLAGAVYLLSDESW